MKTKGKYISNFNQSGCLSLNGIELFISSNISEAERKKMEKHIHCCPLCREAIEGYTDYENKDELIRAVSMINKKMDKILSRKVGDNLKNKKTKYLYLNYFSYVAAASVIILLGFFLYNSTMKEKVATEMDRLADKGGFLSDTLDYFNINRSSENKIAVVSSEDLAKNISIDEEVIKKDNEKIENLQNLENDSPEDISGEYKIKNEMNICAIKEPELLKAINCPFEVFVQKKIDALLVMSPKPVKYNFMAEFIVSKDGLIKQTRILSSSDSRLDSFAVKVLEGSPQWKPGTINNTPVDFPVRIIIRKD